VVGGVLGNLAVGYVSVGNLQFITAASAIEGDSPALESSRIDSLVQLLRAFNFKQIANDHSIDIDSGYARAICPGV